MEEWGLAREPMSDKEAELKNPLTLAFIGDTVWDLLVRQALLDTSARVNALHRRATAVVNAGAQSLALERLEPLLEEPEKAIVRRGANAHCGHGFSSAGGAARYPGRQPGVAHRGFRYPYRGQQLPDVAAAGRG